MTLTLYLILTFLSIYGWSWTVSKSTILKDFRGYLANRSSPLQMDVSNKPIKRRNYKLYRFMYKLTTCIVCTSFWIAIFHIALTHITNSEFMYLTNDMYGIFSLLGSAIAAVWIVANLTGDAD